MTEWMRMRLMGSLLFVVWAAFATPVSAQASSSSPPSDFFTPSRIRAFADHLHEQGDYRRAIAEYQRYLFSGEIEHRPRVLFQIGLSYYKLDEPVQAAPHFLEVGSQAEDVVLRDSARLAYAASLLRSGMHAQLFDVVRPQDPSLQLRLTEMTALAHMGRGEWNEAEYILTSNPSALAQNQASAPVPPIIMLVERGRNLPHKSPIVAATMSALVPGAGKVYSRRLEDGIYSLVVIGGLSRLAYEGFRDGGKSSAKGWIFGTVGAVLYAGNVYGSVVAVRLYNSSHQEALLNDIQAQISFSTRL